MVINVCFKIDFFIKDVFLIVIFFELNGKVFVGEFIIERFGWLEC